MGAQSVQALTVGMRGTAVAGVTVTARMAAAKFEMFGHFPVGELKQLECEYDALVELAESGAPIFQMPKSAS